jgi:hypothetical protein
MHVHVNHVTVNTMRVNGILMGVAVVAMVGALIAQLVRNAEIDSFSSSCVIPFGFSSTHTGLVERPRLAITLLEGASLHCALRLASA